MLKSMRKSKNRYFYHIFVSPVKAPGTITRNVVWMEREFDAYKSSRSMYPSTFNSFPVIRTAIAKNRLFHVPQPSFLFPWKRPCDYHAICCTDGKQIRCLPNAWQHVRITRTLSKIASIVSELYVMCKSKNRYFTTFWFPLVQSG